MYEIITIMRHGGDAPVSLRAVVLEFGQRRLFGWQIVPSCAIIMDSYK